MWLPRSVISASSRNIRKQVIERPPRYVDLREHLGSPYDNSETTCGWRLESYIVEHLLACKDGLVDTTPKYEHLNIFSSKAESDKRCHYNHF